jgi:spermidine/putrescine transport system substrate-binding protein
LKKRLFCALLALAAIAAVIASSGCAKETTSGETLYVYNWGEYISDGSDESLDVIKAFEQEYGVSVVYTTYPSNEDMYAKLKSGAANYDVVFPSDYMAARLIDEGLVQQIDYNNIPNFEYIASEYQNLYYDTENLYTVPYTVGRTGLIYNTAFVTEAPDSWAAMWDEKYSGQILTFNNPRDAFSLAQFLLGIDVNTQDPADWDAVYDKMLEQKPLIQGYVMDEIFNKMENNEAWLAPYYAGDFLTMQDNNPSLEFVYPKEGVNEFYDVMCIPTASQNKELAETFINFMLDPEISRANAEYICYASPNTAVFEDEDYALYQNPYLYPQDGAKVQKFENLPQETLSLINEKWSELKIDGGEMSLWVYVAGGALVVAMAAFIIVRSVNKKKKEAMY